MAETNVAEAMARLPEMFKPAYAGGVNAVFQIKLNGEGGGDWTITIKDKTCTVTEGKAPSARVTIISSSQDFLNVVNGKLNGMQAVMAGRIKVQGDMSMAAKFPSMFGKN